MFKLNMATIRQNAKDYRLMAIQANLANTEDSSTKLDKKFIPLANLAVSHFCECNSEKSLIASHSLMKQVIASAMRCCDQHKDSQQARDEMTQQCLETPPHLAEDLLNYFNKTYGVKK